MATSTMLTETMLEHGSLIKETKIMYKAREFICDNRTTMEIIVKNFKQEKHKKKVWGNFRIEGRTLVYKSIPTVGYYSWINGKSVEILAGQPVVNTVAIKTASGLLLGNASILPLIGAYSAYGNQQANRGQTVIQKVLETDPEFNFIPFNVFEESGLHLETFEMIEKGPAEKVTVRTPNPNYYGNNKSVPQWLFNTTHFLGSRLFKVEDSFFLFDIDRQEIKHKIFNAFLVKLPKKCKTVEEAYEILKPNVVKRAYLAGLDVKRQGEWFFIPIKKSPLKKLTHEQQMVAGFSLALENTYLATRKQVTELIGKSQVEKIHKQAKKLPIPMPMELRAGKNSPNNATQGVKVGERTFVKGTISHSGREHQNLILDSWHEAICNTANESFTIVGDID